MIDFDSTQPHFIVSFVSQPADPKAVEMQLGAFNVPDIGPVKNLMDIFVRYAKNFPRALGGQIEDGRKEISTANDRTPEESRIISPGVQRQDGNRDPGLFRVGGSGSVIPIRPNDAPVLDLITGRPVGGN